MPADAHGVSRRCVLVTGSRAWTDVWAVKDKLDAAVAEAVADGVTELIVRHGACYPRPDGQGHRPFESADYLAHLWIRRYGPSQPGRPAGSRCSTSAGGGTAARGVVTVHGMSWSAGSTRSTHCDAASGPYWSQISRTQAADSLTLQVAPWTRRVCQFTTLYTRTRSFTGVCPVFST